MGKLKAMERAIRDIKSNWRDGKTLKEVAERYGVDAGNLERAFRNREGVTIKQFVDQRRKVHVMARLQNKTRFGNELGAELGFANARAFYRWVTRAFGGSFAKLRKEAKGEVRLAGTMFQNCKIPLRKPDFTKRKQHDKK